MPLKEYRKKRDFKSTTEPEAAMSSRKGAPVFVVQRHAARKLHYDFRLELNGVLKSWAVPKGPSLDPDDKRLAVMVEDHPFEYKDFEGTIPAGNYGAGSVDIWDKGTYEMLSPDTGKETQDGIKGDSLSFRLKGKKLKGVFTLVKMKGKGDKNWLLIKKEDRYSQQPYDAEAHRSGKDAIKPAKPLKATKEERKKKAAPQTASALIRPMLAQTGQAAFDSKDWIFEVKWDGYRAIADLRNKAVRLYSRNGLAFERKYPAIVKALKEQEHEMVLDGELVALDKKGNVQFNLLQHYEPEQDTRLLYQVFDLLWLNGHSTEKLSLLERKELLQAALQENDFIRNTPFINSTGKDLFHTISKDGKEGIIAKKAESRYHQHTRSAEWLKIKTNNTDEVIVCGFTLSKAIHEPFGALILGRYEDNHLVYAGHCGTGFTQKTKHALMEQMQSLIRKKCPFEQVPVTNMPATWLKPERVAEIRYSEITAHGVYRHPVFLHLRADKNPGDLNNESMNKKASSKAALNLSLNRKQIQISNPDKLYFPKEQLSKEDIVMYYQRMAAYILPYLKDRPLSLHRFPEGITEAGFFQKDAGQEAPDWVKSYSVYAESADKDINYIICNNKATMAYLNNLGCIDFNPWNSRTKDLHLPDYLVLDLDPSAKNDFDDVVEVALQIKAILDDAGIDGYCKTSGASGMHIYLPLRRKYDYGQAKDFAHMLMKKTAEALPGLCTLERNLQSRAKNKVYLDYLQNRFGQTLASAYSLRPKAGAAISTPLDWEEIKKGIKPGDFNINNIEARVRAKGDLFAAVLGKGIDMLRALSRLETS
ncbi:MAG: DNA ligase D [Bacteroidetes bacterium 43-16]|nr:MAG: DNA ligase D [Bacteroidetes bacterium 43-16]